MATTTEPVAVTTGRIELRREGWLLRNGRTVEMVCRREIIRFFRMPARYITGLAQPILFLVVLGAGIEPLVGGRAAAGVDFQQYLLPGVLAMSVLFSAFFSSVSIVWDREFGFLREMLVAPVSRTGLVIGKLLGSALVAVGQGIILLIAAPFLGVDLGFLDFLAVFGLMLLLAFSLTAFGILIASRMQRMESFQMVMALVINPMLFLSGAIFPINDLPEWLKVATRLNPVTYGVDPIRRVMLPQAQPLTIGSWTVPIWFDVLVVVGIGAICLALAVRSFRRTE
ncbi:MAG: ABC transporter permease [Acidimicrobiia bacterium]